MEEWDSTVVLLPGRKEKEYREEDRNGAGPYVTAQVVLRSFNIKEPRDVAEKVSAFLRQRG